MKDTQPANDQVVHTVMQPPPEANPRPESSAEPVWSGGLADGRTEVIWLALAAAEVSWVTPILMTLNWARNPHSPVLLWLGVLILMLGYFYFYRALLAAKLTLRLQQGLLVLGLLLSIALILRFHVYAGLALQGTDQFLMPFSSLVDVAAVFPRSGLAIMILVFLWARAVHLANRSVTANGVGFSFRSGVLVLIVVAFFARVFADLDVPGFVVPYFFFSLLALALARIEDVTLLPNSSPVPFSGFWIGSSVVAVTALVLLGTLAALFFYDGGLRQVLKWLSPVVLAVQIIFVGLVVLVVATLDWILTLLSLDLSALGQGVREVLQQLGQLLPLTPTLPPPTGEEQVRPIILVILQVIVNVAIPLAVISLVLLFTWRRLRRGRRDEVEDEGRESLLSARAVARNLQAMLQDGLDRLGELAGLVRRFGPGPRFLAAVSIRRIYANMVRLATEAGYPRAKAETPYEYLPVLFTALPGNEEDLTVITEAYVNAHYGQVPDTREDLQRIRDCWERVRAQEVKRDRRTIH